MDRKTLEQRIKNLEQIKENHIQDNLEIDYVLAGMKKQLDKMPKEPEEKKDLPTGV
jgi:hypothetical protein